MAKSRTRKPKHNKKRSVANRSTIGPRAISEDHSGHDHSGHDHSGEELLETTDSDSGGVHYHFEPSYERLDPPVARPAPARSPAKAKAAPVVAKRSTQLGSALSEEAKAECDYVFRDLRNIGWLSLIMVILLALAWFASNALGLYS